MTVRMYGLQFLYTFNKWGKLTCISVLFDTWKQDYRLWFMNDFFTRIATAFIKSSYKSRNATPHFLRMRLKFFDFIQLQQKVLIPTQLMIHYGFPRIDSNQLTTRNGFLEFHSTRLTTQWLSRISIRIDSRSHDSKNFPVFLFNATQTNFLEFWFKSTHDSKTFWYIDSNQPETQLYSWLSHSIWHGMNFCLSTQVKN